MRIGIDLLWVRPGKNGGTESYIRNLLDGFNQYCSQEFAFVLFTNHENEASFLKYKDKFIIKTCECPSSQIKRVIWESVYLNKSGKEEHLDLWFYPVYSRPFFPPRDIPNITVIHDLQALHYPKNFSIGRDLFFKLMWKSDVRNSTEIATISQFCKKDIIDNYHIASDKIKVIYNAINAEGDATSFKVLAKRYAINKKEYYYTVSSLAKHKNLMTLIKAINLLRSRDPNIKLVISGVKVNAANEISTFKKNNKLENNIIYTGYISDEDRNGLLDNCKKFLFPSIFEGFGMPPVEAMIRKVPVLTTKSASLDEVTEGLCDYVDNPEDYKEWGRKILENGKTLTDEQREKLKNKYSLKNIALQYLNLFKEMK